MPEGRSIHLELCVGAWRIIILHFWGSSERFPVAPGSSARLQSLLISRLFSTAATRDTGSVIVHATDGDWDEYHSPQLPSLQRDIAAYHDAVPSQIELCHVAWWLAGASVLILTCLPSHMIRCRVGGGDKSEPQPPPAAQQRAHPGLQGRPFQAELEVLAVGGQQDPVVRAALAALPQQLADQVEAPPPPHRPAPPPPPPPPGQRLLSCRRGALRALQRCDAAAAALSPRGPGLSCCCAAILPRSQQYMRWLQSSG